MEIIQYVQTLPDKVNFAQSVVNDTTTKYTDLLNKCNGAIWANLTLEALNKTDAILANSAADAHAAAQRIEADRKPITLKLDEFKKEFTSREKMCYDFSIALGEHRKKIALEIKRRADIEAEKLLKKTYQTNEEIEFKRTLNQYLVDKSYSHAQDTMRAMYNGSLVSDIDQYNLFLSNLIAFDPKKTINADTLSVWLSHFTFKFVYIDPVVPVAMLDTWNDFIAPQLEKYKQDLIAQADQRKDQILSKKETTAKQVTDTLNTISSVLNESKEAAVNAVNAASESEVIHKSFETYQSVSTPRQNKGVKIPQELAPVNPGEWLNVIKFYIDNIYPTLDMETIDKKLGFMLTAVNKSMKDDGIMPDGVTVVDKVKLTRNRSAS